MSHLQGWSEFWPGGFYHLVKTGLNHLIKPTKTGQKWSKLKYHWFLQKIKKNLVILWLFQVLIDVFGLLNFNFSDFILDIVLLLTSILHVSPFEKSYFDNFLILLSILRQGVTSPNENQSTTSYYQKNMWRISAQIRLVNFDQFWPIKPG